MNNQEQPTTEAWSRRKKIFILFLVISLIVHILSLLFIFNVSFRKQSIKIMHSILDSLTPTERKKQALQRQEFMQKIRAIKLEEARNRPAKLRAPKSDFGWVFFEDIPAQPKRARAEIPTTLEGPVATAPTAFATETKPEPGAPQPTVALPPTPPAEAKPTPVQPQAAAQQPPVAHKKATPLTHVPAKKTLKTKTKTTVPHHEAATKVKTILEEKPAPTIEEAAQKATTAPSRAPLKKQKYKETSIESLVDELKHESTDEPSNEEPITELVEQHEQFFEEFVEPQEPTPDIKARIEKITHMQEQLSHFGGSAGIKPGTIIQGGSKPATAKVRGARTAKPKTGREIIALTKGFVEKHEGEEGTDLIDRDGDDTKMPSFEEMKYISYEANINWCLQSSWKQNFAYLQQESPHNTTAIIEFTLDAKGYVTRAELLQSSGYKGLDAMIMKNIKYASPFPPVPKHFGVKEYTTGRLIHVICNNFGL